VCMVVYGLRWFIRRGPHVLPVTIDWRPLLKRNRWLLSDLVGEWRP